MVALSQLSYCPNSVEEFLFTAALGALSSPKQRIFLKFRGLKGLIESDISSQEWAACEFFCSFFQHSFQFQQLRRRICRNVLALDIATNSVFRNRCRAFRCAT